MKQERDKKGRFMPIGKATKKRKPFNERYVKAGARVITQDDLENCFLDAFESGRKLKITITAREAWNGWLTLNGGKR